MLKGVIIALGLQSKAVYANIFSQWGVNLTLVYFFSFYLNLGEIGLWYAKWVMECYIFVLYLAIILYRDWAIVIRKSNDRLEREK